MIISRICSGRGCTRWILLSGNPALEREYIDILFSYIAVGESVIFNPGCKLSFCMGQEGICLYIPKVYKAIAARFLCIYELLI